MKATQVFLWLVVIVGMIAFVVVIVGVATVYVVEGAGTPIPPTPPYSEMLPSRTPTPDPYPGMAPTATPGAYPQGAVVVERASEPYLAESFTPADAGLWAWIWDLFTGG